MATAAEPQQRKSKNDSKTWTIILQQKSPEEYIARYGAGLAKFYSAIQFTDIFHSYWFAFLLILLCVNLGCCTVKRWRNTVLMIGFLVTHISIILILVGCVIDMLAGVKGGVLTIRRCHLASRCFVMIL